MSAVAVALDERGRSEIGEARAGARQRLAASLCSGTGVLFVRKKVEKTLQSCANRLGSSGVASISDRRKLTIAKLYPSQMLFHPTGHVGSKVV